MDSVMSALDCQNLEFLGGLHSKKIHQNWYTSSWNLGSELHEKDFLGVEGGLCE